MDTNNIKSLNRLPEWVTVTSEWVISCTRDALNHLGDWCKKNAGALAISVFATTGVNAALAWTPAHVDTQSPSATLQATKGYWQEVILKDGTKVSFAEISKKPDAEKKEILGKMERFDKISFKEWETQATINEGKKIDEWTQAAIADADAAATRKQEAITKATASILQLEGTVKKVLKAWGKLTKDDKAHLESIIAFGKPPETVKFFKEVIKDPNNFA